MSSSEPDDTVLPPAHLPAEEKTAPAALSAPAGEGADASAPEAAPVRKPRKPRARKPAAEAVAAPEEEVVEPAASDEPAAPAPAPAPVAAPQPVRAEPAPADEVQDDQDEEDEPDEEEDELDRARRIADRERRNAPPTEPIRFADVISGQFDADEESAEVPPLKRVLLPEADSPKLHKVLAQAGLGSRLEMEALILQGRISVNSEPAHIGQRIQYGDQVKINGKPIRFRIDPPQARVIAYHKPVGEVVTHDDPQNRPTVFRKLPRLQQGKWQSVGRLDLNTEGLLLFTSSGELANQLMHPRFGLEREYAVRVLGAVNAEEKKKLLEGVRLDDGMAQFGSIEEGGGEGANHWYRVTISEGRNREVRRLFESVGHAVSRLIRIRYGAMLLPRGLKRGAWMELDERDIRSLFQAAGGGAARAPAGPREQGAEGGGRNNNGRGDNKKRRGGRNAGGPPMPNGNGPQGARGGDRGRGGNPGGPQQKRRGNAPGGGGGGGNGRAPGEDRAPGGAQPDPMKTSVGYIGADSFSRQRKEQRQNAPRRGGGGGFGGPAGSRRRSGR
ncbi:pseudouridine synthase [Variovorax sp. UMC13]|uniref:pseudouridine synthase n=1 Tax=Variovorax sp. UMC13 TaxID=1862326 RepID=UPI00160316A3|nr:pseudouridine synthase [Variovorax sp. UMC13]MBB1604408.1 23S rRNA pseudouridylate synthase B [Variovorax sp. UMC13]